MEGISPTSLTECKHGFGKLTVSRASSCHPGTGMEGGLGDRGEELLKHQLWRRGGRQRPHWNSWKHHGYNQRRLWFINLKQAMLAHGTKFKRCQKRLKTGQGAPALTPAVATVAAPQSTAAISVLYAFPGLGYVYMYVYTFFFSHG